ncbi:Nitrilase [Sporomusa silvacetica DSM 10669]|uniref:Nitrilase n=1 Tax=Sporomusa silvacetica DSM 10669 TaxID=1123289 RepID=A0ABZ3IW06_9FIRM|nr:carbon-nitrogen hydrolase family protein [Sporomusa silvacetica]OZC14265.1 nitrilase [Sporomusa silvacetica DSM 10669]
MEKTFPKFKAAAVQAAPVFLDLGATVEKTCTIIEEAAGNGAQLVAFPEAFIPGYPWWIWLGDPVYGMPFYGRLYKNAVEIPGPAVRKISEAAKKTGTYVSVSATELEGGSLYLTQLWFNPNGDLMGKHRKMKPSSAERYIWGDGNGSMMPVFDTKIGRLGGLECAEHVNPLNVIAMNSLNEQVHVAAWPAFKCDIGPLFGEEVNVIVTKNYAIATQTFTLMATQIISDEMINIMCINDEQKARLHQGGGCAQIISPAGAVISNLVPDNQEGIVYADIDLEMIMFFKYAYDFAGQYSNPSLSLNFNQNPQSPVRKIGKANDLSLSYNQLQDE